MSFLSALAVTNFRPTSGKWFIEFHLEDGSGTTYFGVGYSNESKETFDANYTINQDFEYKNNGNVYNTAGTISGTLNSYTTGDVIGFALDVDSKAIGVYKNGIHQATYTLPDYTYYYGVCRLQVAGQATVNNGSNSWQSATPAGYTRWVTG